MAVSALTRVAVGVAMFTLDVPKTIYLNIAAFVSIIAQLTFCIDSEPMIFVG